MSVPSYSVTIQTFVHRYKQYFVPLIHSVCRMRPDIDKVIFVNGQHKKSFDQNYRREILQLAAQFPNTYVIMSPIFRGCSYMWNTCFNHTSTPYCLNLNDDVTLAEGFFDDYESMLDYNNKQGDESFRINNSFSHFSVYREDLFDVGYFDERLLAIGEEDGDWLWAWEAKRNKPMRIYQTSKVTNHVDQSEMNGENMIKGNRGKYAIFNADWIFKHKYYHPDEQPTLNPNKPSAVSMYGRPIQMRDGAVVPNYYPAEKWYRDNIQFV